jgi:hypothetical protein
MDYMGYLWIVILLPVPFTIYRLIIAPRRLRKRLLVTGLPGTARIHSVTDTGVTVNGSPKILYTCTIAPANGGTPYTATNKVLLSRLVYSQPGR